MTGTPINGSDLMLFLKGDAEDYISIAFATSHTLSLSTETIETSSKDTGGKWVSKAPRKLSWTTSTENLYAVEGDGKTFDDLFTLWSERKEIITSLEVNAPNGDNATFTASFEGVGALTKV